jgi:ABC-type amino acid transport substrate-binding protein
MRRSRGAFLAVGLVAAVLVTGCGVQIPADPSGTLDAVTGGMLRVGVSPSDGLIDVAGEEPAGSEVDAIRGFADSLEADIAWTVGSEEALVRELENGELDLVAGGLTDETPWTEKAGVTRPYAETTDDDGKTRKLVMLVPPGENAFLARLETYLTENPAEVLR